MLDVPERTGSGCRLGQNTLEVGGHWRLAGMSETAALNAAVPAADVSRRRRVSGLIASGYDRRPWRTRRREEAGDGAAVKLR